MCKLPDDASACFLRYPQIHTLPSFLAATVDLLDAATSSAPPLKFLNQFNAPRWLFRTVACLVLGGQVITRICKGIQHASNAECMDVIPSIFTDPIAICAGKIHWRNTRDQLMLVGPKSLGVALLTAGFVGMVFTIQVRRVRTNYQWQPLLLSFQPCSRKT